MPDNNYKWTKCNTTISGSDDGEPNGQYWATLSYDRETDRVTVLINWQDIGMHMSMRLFKEQLASWFAAIEAKA